MVSDLQLVRLYCSQIGIMYTVYQLDQEMHKEFNSNENCIREDTMESFNADLFEKHNASDMVSLVLDYPTRKMSI